MASQEDPDLRSAVLASDLTVPDGQPLAWAMDLLGHSLPSRLYGPDLFVYTAASAPPALARASTSTAGARRRSSGCAPDCHARYPGLQLAGVEFAPFRELSDEEAGETADRINASGADVVWVGLGVPLQEKWMARMRERPGVGAAFDFHAAIKKQAPDGLQRLGLEWAFRLTQEPRRLWRRLRALQFALRHLVSTASAPASCGGAAASTGLGDTSGRSCRNGGESESGRRGRGWRSLSVKRKA